MSTFIFQPAVRDRVSLLIALAGASGSGKTYSALRLAKGMSPDSKIAFIDTEARRGLHYAQDFAFLHADMRPPFRPEHFIEAIHAAEAAGAEVVIIDSFSHEYDGEGGIMDWADALAEKGVKSPGNWKEPKLAHKKMMNTLLQCRASIIFCLRADEKIEIVRENGKTAVRPLGWVPICEKRFMYEMTASFTLTPDRPGRPHFDLPHKLQQQHRGMFSEDRPIDEQSGHLLLDWARGGSGAAVAQRDADPSPASRGPSAGAADPRPASQPDETMADDAGRSNAATDPDIARRFRDMLPGMIDRHETAEALGTWWNSAGQKQQRADLLTADERRDWTERVKGRVALLRKADDK